MTESCKKEILNRATEEYALAYVLKIGPEIMDKPIEKVLVEFVREVVEPRKMEKESSQMHH